MKLQKLLAKADNDIFDEIIKACKSKMASPFKKEEMMVEPESEPEMEQESELSEDDIEALKKLLG